MMHSIQNDDDMQENSLSSDDTNHSGLFSPIRGRRRSLHDNEEAATPIVGEDSTLPRLADNSWIGARVSPIPSLEDDDDDAIDLELDQVTAPYHNAMQNFGAHERTALLGRRIHPLWETGGGRHGDSAPSQSLSPVIGHPQHRDLLSEPWWPTAPRPPIWGKVVMICSGIHGACMGLHDIFFWYLSVRRGIENQTQPWSLPWLAPSKRILLRFGAFSPTNLTWFHQYYRTLASLVVSSSVLEYVLVVFAWWQVERLVVSRGGTATNWRLLWPIFYLLSAVTGQLWMAAFAPANSVSGCVSWGTCGVLCAMGISRPDDRLVLFLTAIALVLANLFQPTSSVFGAIGASFFGWSLYGVGLAPPAWEKNSKSGPKRKWRCLHWLAALTVVKLWLIPILYILLVKT